MKVFHKIPVFFEGWLPLHSYDKPTAAIWLPPINPSELIFVALQKEILGSSNSLRKTVTFFSILILKWPGIDLSSDFLRDEFDIRSGVLCLAVARLIGQDRYPNRNWDGIIWMSDGSSSAYNFVMHFFKILLSPNNFANKLNRHSLHRPGKSACYTSRSYVMHQAMLMIRNPTTLQLELNLGAKCLSMIFLRLLSDW